SREQTHYFGLDQADFDDEELVSQVRRGFASKGDGEPALAAGYLSHLIADKIWIRDIYRPFFAPGAPLGVDSMAELYDRALQFQIDMVERERSNLAQLSQVMAVLKVKDWSGLDKDTLKRWRSFILESLQSERSWQTFPQYVRDFLLPHGKVKQEMVGEFLAFLPDRVKRLAEYVPQVKIDAVKQKSVTLSVMAAKEYLYANLG
ncbi:MAG: hypothetical protein AAB037_02285, partial [Chloroflexota bacterium]